MRTSATKSIVPAAALIGYMLVAAIPSRAQLVFHVDLDTSPLIAHLAGPFSLDFDLLDGSGSGDANNVAALSGFTFVGGGATGLPVLFGGAGGDLLNGVTLTDRSFFNDFQQGFSPGTYLSFDVSLTTNADAGGTPDEFSFKILDRTGVEIPTLGFGDKLLVIDITGQAPIIETFGGDTSRTPAGGGGAINLFAPVVTFGRPAAVPEPSGLALALAVPLALGLLWRRGARA